MYKGKQKLKMDLNFNFKLVPNAKKRPKLRELTPDNDWLLSFEFGFTLFAIVFFVNFFHILTRKNDAFKAF